MNYKGFKELECYIQGRNLGLQVSELVTLFPAHEKFSLVDQIIRSSRSVTTNIAEGYGRYTYSDTRNFFIIARGSVTETMEHLQTAFDEKCINEAQLIQFEQQCELVFKLINGYISYLDKSKQKKSNGNNP